MNQPDLFPAYDSNNMQYAAPSNGRSPPSSNRGYGQQQHTLIRQSSRQFDTYDPSSYHHNAQRNDPSGRFDGMAASSLQFPPPYDSNSWNQMGNGMQQAHSNLHGLGSQMGMGMSMGSATLGPSSRRPQSSRRTPLPSHWPMEHQQPSFERNGGSQPYNDVSHSEQAGDSDEELIPTAIVIKNIPFAVKKEQLTEIMSNNNLPLPYAFNYHFDSGVFRGLAFANFSSALETQHVIEVMNHMEISGRKLRVEYKKMLPQRERERIEREKRERRGQLQEQHQPQANAMLQSQPSISSLTAIGSIPTTSPSPVSTRMGTDEVPRDTLDMNDQTTLDYYTELMVFIGDGSREVLIFPASIPPHERRIIHTIAHQKNLDHKSRGQGDQRQVVVSKIRNLDISPPQPAPMPLNSFYSNESRSRGLNRAATTDFSSTRGDIHYHNLERQSSFLDIPNGEQSNAFSTGPNMRGAKSFADLRSHSGSPSLLSSAGSFAPQMPSISRYEVGGLPNGRSATPNLTPTSSNNTASHEELLGTMNSLSLGFSNERSGTNRSNGRLNMERDNYGATTGAIGSHRQANGTYEDRNGGPVAPDRQPKIPSWGGSPFSRARQNGLGSRGDGELDRNGSANGWNGNRS